MPHNKEAQYPIPLGDRVRSTFRSMKEGARDYSTRHQIDRRNFPTGLAATSITAAFGTDAVFTWNRMNKKVEDLNNQLPQPPEEVINKARIDIQTFESNQRLTENKFQEGMSQQALKEIQNKKQIVDKNIIYEKKQEEQVVPEEFRFYIDVAGVIMATPLSLIGKSVYELS